MNSKAIITLVILSYNVKSITDECLTKAEKAAEHLKRATNLKANIILVDNASSDGTAEMVKSKHKKIKLFALKENLGVSKGYNLGMKHSKTELILLMNSDTLLHKDTLVKAVSFISDNADCSVLMVKLTTRKGEFRPYGGYLPTPKRLFFWLLGLESFPYLNKKLKRIYSYKSSLYNDNFEMEWAPTCFFLLRKEVYEKTKGHDENLFLYMDDIEFCKRIKDAGFKIYFTPVTSAIHLGGESSDKQLPQLSILKFQVYGIRYYFKKHFPGTYRLVNSLLFFGFSARAFLYILLGKPHSSLAYLKSLKSPL